MLATLSLDGIEGRKAATVNSWASDFRRFVGILRIFSLSCVQYDCLWYPTFFLTAVFGKIVQWSTLGSKLSDGGSIPSFPATALT